MTPTAPAPSENEKDRISNWKIALISAGSALVGALIGGVSSYFVAVHTSTSQAAEDRSNFLRQQRQTAYARFVSDLQIFNNDLNIWCDKIAIGKADNKDHTHARADFLRLQNDQAAVVIVGPDEAAASAVHAATNQLRYLDNLEGMLDSDGNPPPPDLDPWQETSTYQNTANQSLNTDVLDFEAAARRAID